MNGLAATFRRFIVLTEHDADVLALWTLHTYSVPQNLVSPVLLLSSPVKGCGKSTARDVLAELVYRPLSADSVSAAVAFRVNEAMAPTWLLDDCDSWLPRNEDMLSLVLTGNRRTGRYFRCETEGKRITIRGFNTYSGKCLNQIGMPSAALLDRCLIVTLQRRKRGQPIEPLKRLNGEIHRRMCQRWTLDHWQPIGTPSRTCRSSCLTA